MQAISDFPIIFFIISISIIILGYFSNFKLHGKKIFLLILIILMWGLGLFFQHRMWTQIIVIFGTFLTLSYWPWKIWFNFRHSLINTIFFLLCFTIQFFFMNLSLTRFLSNFGKIKTDIVDYFILARIVFIWQFSFTCALFLFLFGNLILKIQKRIFQ